MLHGHALRPVLSSDRRVRAHHRWEPAALPPCCHATLLPCYPAAHRWEPAAEWTARGALASAEAAEALTRAGVLATLLRSTDLHQEIMRRAVPILSVLTAHGHLDESALSSLLRAIRVQHTSIAVGIVSALTGALPFFPPKLVDKLVDLLRDVPRAEVDETILGLAASIATAHPTLASASVTDLLWESAVAEGAVPTVVRTIATRMLVDLLCGADRNGRAADEKAERLAVSL